MVLNLASGNCCFHFMFQSNFSSLVLFSHFRHIYYNSNLTDKITVLIVHLKWNLIKLILFLLLQLVIVNSAYAILSATSAHFIVGNAPKVVALNSADKQGFRVGGTFYSEAGGNIKADEIKEFNGNLRFNDFEIVAYTSQNLDRINNYSDIDGDDADGNIPFLIEQTTYEWYDNSGIRINKTETSDPFNNIIGCGSGYAMPLRLIIKTDVKAHSAYGIPDEGESITLSKSYQIAAMSELCYAKPNGIIARPKEQWIGYNSDRGSESWNDENHTKPHPIHGGGFTDDYVPNYGFKANPTISSNKFPTTGFPGAKFQLVMTGAQTDYLYRIISNPGSGVSIDDNGIVLLRNKPTGNVTIRAILKRDTAVYHDYTFNPTLVWLIPQGNNYMGWEAAKQRCGGVQNLPSLSMFTNSPQNSIAPNTGWQGMPNTFTRAIGGGVFAEWGYSDIKSYPNSQWGDFANAMDGKAFYWSSNIHTKNYYMFVGDARAGNVNTYDMKYQHLVACKG
ncbi:hypothetical protein [Gilliamella sp. Pas-s27]|uniref:hypothetical protein n=1 Tax=Gilliamella sp. Pas-s27 TaxID=2687311 RepID=UPI001F3D53F6|nr:hypothetical protein [Gilliamella sp. Pas-s27]